MKKIINSKIIINPGIIFTVEEASIINLETSAN